MAILKKIQDYYEDIYKEFPTLAKSDIKKILLYGWKTFNSHSKQGADILFSYPNFWACFGNLTKNSIKHFNHYKHKMKLKLRIMYTKKHISWDGYYYFALSKKLYEDYLNLKKSKGRPRKHFIFSKIVLYKIYDECSIVESNKVAIFRIPKILPSGFSYFVESIKTDKAELILERNPLTLNDILLSVYEYQFISDDASKHKKKINNGSS